MVAIEKAFPLLVGSIKYNSLEYKGSIADASSLFVFSNTKATQHTNYKNWFAGLKSARWSIYS